MAVYKEGFKANNSLQVNLSLSFSGVFWMCFRIYQRHQA
jgi:hypothetical protein